MFFFLILPLLRLIANLPVFSKFDNIFFLVSGVFVFRTFGCMMYLEDLTFRLPHDVRPLNYILQLYPDFESQLFSGEVMITVEVLCESRFIALHAKDLTIHATRISAVKQFNDTSIVIGDLLLKRVSRIDEFEMIIVETRRIILPGKYEIRMKFNGTMSNESRGFFMTSYVDSYTGIERKIATTKFRPTHTRRAFPCFDEPGFKAIFHIQLVQPNINGYHSLSNMPSKVSMPGAPLPGLTTVHFEPSLPMSPHLVTFVISDFANKTAFVANFWDEPRHIPIQAWTSEDNLIRADLVLHVTYHAIDSYIHLFGIDYPLPKIDMVAMPRSARIFNENWGLGTLDETSMLFYDRANSITDLKICANRIANQLVRVWFGNLVSLEWWNDYWLMESFAIYMQYYTTDYIFPDWKEIGNFVIDSKYPSMTRDALFTAEPIVQAADSPAIVERLLGAISAKKGASIIRTLHYMMGERNFFHGVASYLQLYRYRATVTDDFLNCLQDYYTRRESLVRLVHTWTRQSGHPVLNVARIGNTYYINQTRFTINDFADRVPIDSPYSYKWDLPIFYTTNRSNWPKRIFMSYQTERVELLVDEQIRWVKFNANSVGYYTVNYDSRSWNVLSIVLRTRPEDFGVLDRTDLLHDAFVNADADKISYQVPMTMLAYMKYETAYTPWQMVCEKLLQMHWMLRRTLILRKFEVFVRSLIERIYLSTGWDAHPMDTFELRRLRMIIVKMACVVGLKNCLDEVKQRFRDWMGNPNTRPHPDIKEIVYHYGMTIVGDHKDWETVYDLFVAETNVQERQQLMISLTAVQNSSLLLTFLQIAKDLRVMNADEYLTTIRAASQSPIGSRIIWDFYRINWSFLTSRYSKNDREFARLIIPITSRFRAAYRIDELRNFFDMNPYGELSADARKEAQEIVRNNAFWLERNYNEIKIWLEAYYLG